LLQILNEVVIGTIVLKSSGQITLLFVNLECKNESFSIGLKGMVIMAIQSAFNSSRFDDRMYCDYPALVHVICSSGVRLKLNATTESLGVGGMYLQLTCLLPYDARLFTCICLPNHVRLAAIGYVVRTENTEHELIGTAVCFTRTRLLPMLS
jgi:hypothetical protein